MSFVLPTSWNDYREIELAHLKPILSRLGFILDGTQVHIGGERAVISGRKLVLLGTQTKDGKRVVIKASSSPEGKQEMEREHRCRHVLDHLRFSYRIFHSPQELLWQEDDGCRISITEFLAQEHPFLERPLQEQFFLALQAFETQESAHAATYEHARMIRGAFPVFEPETYLDRTTEYIKTVSQKLPNATELHTLLRQGQSALVQGAHRLKQYAGFLTHGDFVPHNLRIVGRDIYLLDHSDIRFGNKYDGWARFLNFMLLHHRALEEALVFYLTKNRGSEEQEALHLMRTYRFLELVWYYAGRLEKSKGSLQELDRARICFWGDALQAHIQQIPLAQERIYAYQTLRDSLRSEEEKQRQRGLH